MALNLFAALMPSEPKFIDLFCGHAQAVVAAAEELRTLLTEESADIEQRLRAICDFEVEADGWARKIFLAANRTFNAPIDRENILQLAHELDDIVDLIEDTAKLIARYRIRPFSSEISSMADAAVTSTRRIQQAIPLLDSITRDYRRILSLCEEIGQAENDADRCFDAGLNQIRRELREGALDVIGYLDRKEIYEYAEAVVDKCDDVANVLETITAKHV